MNAYEKMTSDVQFASDVNGRIAEALHRSLKLIEELKLALDLKDAECRELRMALLMKQAEELS